MASSLWRPNHNPPSALTRLGWLKSCFLWRPRLRKVLPVKGTSSPGKVRETCLVNDISYFSLQYLNFTLSKFSRWSCNCRTVLTVKDETLSIYFHVSHQSKSVCKWSLDGSIDHVLVAPHVCAFSSLHNSDSMFHTSLNYQHVYKQNSNNFILKYP